MKITNVLLSTEILSYFVLFFCESQTSLHIVKLKLDLLQKPTVGLKLIVAKY